MAHRRHIIQRRGPDVQRVCMCSSFVNRRRAKVEQISKDPLSLLICFVILSESKLKNETNVSATGTYLDKIKGRQPLGYRYVNNVTVNVTGVPQ